VVNTLRRKMFSMGGNVPGHHGVGITSGMRYNKGGSVKPGPDGRPRVHAGVGAFLANVALYGLPRAYQVGRGLLTRGRDYLRYGDEGLKAIDDKADEILKASSRYKKTTGKDPFIKVKSREQLLKEMGAKNLARQAGITRAGGLRQAGRLAQGLAGPTGLGLGIGSAVYSDDTPETRGEQLARTLAEGYLDFSAPGAVKAVYDYINTPMGEDVNYQSISSAIKGINPSGKTDTSDILDETVPGIVERISAEDQLRQDFAQRKALYEELMSDSDEGQNNLGVLGRSLLEASEALNQGQGYISAGNVFGTGIADEVARRDERSTSIRDAAATQAITDVMSERAVNQATMQEALLAGDTDTVRTLQGINQAQAAGIPLEKIPTDDGGDLDKEALDERPGTVFIDPDNVIGKGFFVAVNSRGEKASFNDVQAAIEFAET
jgi:hypothetical protein